MINSEAPKVLEKFTLAELASEFFRINEAFNHFYGKLFSIVVPSVEQLTEFTKDLKIASAAVPNNFPIYVLVGDFSELVTVQPEFVPCTESGILKLQYMLSRRQLPSCMYLAVISPAPKLISPRATRLRTRL